MRNGQTERSRLPLWRNLTLAYLFSVVILLIMVTVSIIGLAYQENIYPTENLLYGLIPADILNLFIGSPLLLLSMLLTRENRLIGLLTWPGALFYVLYIYMIYLLAVPFGPLFLLYLILVILSGYTMIGMVASINANKVRERLTDEIPAKAFGALLVFLTLAFIVRQIIVVAFAIIEKDPVSGLDMALWITDFIMAPAWLAGGFLLWRREALGYMAGTGLFLLYSILFIGLVPVLIIQGLYSNNPIDFFGIAFVLIFSIICAIPFLRFIKAAK